MRADDKIEVALVVVIVGSLTRKDMAEADQEIQEGVRELEEGDSPSVDGASASLRRLEEISKADRNAMVQLGLDPNVLDG